MGTLKGHWKQNAGELHQGESSQKISVQQITTRELVDGVEGATAGPRAVEASCRGTERPETCKNNKAQDISSHLNIASKLLETDNSE